MAHRINLIRCRASMSRASHGWWSLKQAQSLRSLHISNLNSTMSNDPFAPSTTTPNPSSHKASKRDVTIPSLPDLHDPQFLDRLLPPAPKSTPQNTQEDAKDKPPGTAFMDALKAEANKQYTQNAAHAFASTLSPTLDLFNGLSQATQPDEYEPLLAKAWREDPLLTVKIIFNLRSIHEGKGEREGFYRAWGWLYRNHPRTAIANLNVLVEDLIARPEKEKKEKKAEEKVDDDTVLVDMDEETLADTGIKPRGLSHGYWKDLLNILILAAEDQLSNPTAEFEALHPARTKRTATSARGGFRGRGRGRGGRGSGRGSGRGRGGHTAPAPTSKADASTRDERIQTALSKDGEKKASAQSARDARHAEFRQQLEKKLKTDKAFRALYIAVARSFADTLSNDIQLLHKIASPNTLDKERIATSLQLSLAGKYAPSIGGAHDRITNISSAIAELLWVRGHLRLPIPTPEDKAALTLEKVQDLRGAYTRWVISPLRRILQIPEIYMSGDRWNQLPYGRVPSKCMQINKKHFGIHDKERFSKYLMDVALGKRQISGATLLPHTLLAEALKAKDDIDKQVIDAQWKTLVDTLRASGALDNSLALVDVSGSMGSIHGTINTQPIFPAVALGIVLAQIAPPPWSNLFVTFSEAPEIVKLDPDVGLTSTAHYMVGTHWGMNTDFNAVFSKLILPLAIKNKLPKEEMIKRLFVFSDMEFDASLMPGTDRSQWITEHEKVIAQFKEAGYEIPEIVYWNLQGSRGAKPVTADTPGVSCLSGFSANMMKVFMEGGEEALDEDEDMEEIEQTADGEVIVKKKEKVKPTPVDIMKRSLNKPSYATLVVLD